MISYHLIAVSFVFFNCFFVSSLGEEIVFPEFVEPIKNITISVGSNVEFNCEVRHLGSFRVMWLKKDPFKESFVAINLLKITKNPRVSVSLQKADDDVTQSTIYIRNIEAEDEGVYECAVNTNPLISRTGTLEIPGNSEESGKYFNSAPAFIKTHENPTNAISSKEKEGNITNQLIEKGGENETTNGTDSSPTENHTLFANDGSPENDTRCSEMKTVWEEATDNIREMLKNVLTSLFNFTCSFLTPSQ